MRNKSIAKVTIIKNIKNTLRYMKSKTSFAKQLLYCALTTCGLVNTSEMVALHHNQTQVFPEGYSFTPLPSRWQLDHTVCSNTTCCPSHFENKGGNFSAQPVVRAPRPTTVGLGSPPPTLNPAGATLLRHSKEEKGGKGGVRGKALTGSISDC